MDNNLSKDEKVKHLDFLTGLKGVACLIVSFNHFAGMFIDRESAFQWTKIPLAIMFNGTFMVSVFFLLSSFFISYSFFCKQDFYKLGQTLFCRSFRFGLPVLVACLLIWGLMQMGAYMSYEEVRNITNSTRPERDALNYFTTYPLIDVFKTAFSSIYTSTTKFTFVIWMLPMLYKGFFITIISMLLLNTLKPSIALITVFVACVFIKQLVGLEYIIFIFGVLFAYIYEKKSRLLEYKWGTVLGVLAMPAVFYLGNYYPGFKFEGVYKPIAWLSQYVTLDYRAIHLLGAILLLWCFLTVKQVQTLFSMDFFGFLGTISFAIYLIHDAVQASIGTKLFLIVYNISSSVVISTVITFIISTFVVLFIGFLFNKYVEAFCYKLISRMYTIISIKH